MLVRGRHLYDDPSLLRLKKQKKDDEDERLLSIFKQIHINLSFLEADSHAKRDLRSLPQKEGDPGSFIQPCRIGPLAENNQLPVVISSALSTVEIARFLKIRDKKYAENLAADHLSRLENPDLRKLTKAEIRDLFLEERLMAIFDKNNEPCPSYSNNVLTESYEDAWPELRQHKFFDNVTTDHLEDIMASPPPQEKSLWPGFTGHISSEMIPKTLINDRGTHLCNYQMEKAMKRYGVAHRFSTAYHPQMNGQVENTNRAIKCILEKTIRNNRKDWSYKLDDALWAFQTAFKTPLGTTSFRIIYGKTCHLPNELEHKAYWAIKNCNLDLTKAWENHFLQINELDEMRFDAYETSISYKERAKDGTING
ncbi:reverse transcriptase domain-containing protein [Tanacetum coccineum]|uniref:Reverse transcriptase domain-containing protein n=1 Tax=Tanacetum coccineum TaxID=301880 RepID=A0ABQ5I8C0_9ASTR